MTIVRKPVIQRADGYRLVYQPEHPNSHKGYVYEHRLVAERMLGRSIRKDEHVHHRNEDPSDNRPANLQVLTIREHRRLHNSTTTLTDDEILALIKSGYTLKRLQEEHGVNPRRGIYVRRAAGIVRKLYDKDEIARLIESGMRDCDIARQIGCRPSVVWEARQKLIEQQEIAA